MIDQNGSFRIVSNGLELKFNVVEKDLIAGKKYFFRAYARNKEGGYGPVLDFENGEKFIALVDRCRDQVWLRIGGPVHGLVPFWKDSSSWCILDGAFGNGLAVSNGE